MKLLKRHPVLRLANSYFIDSPLPSNISYFWNYGSLLGLCLILQIATGVTLAMHYAPTTSLAFISVEHIMGDVFYGWLIRYAHSNGAAFFFICVYIHIARGLYYNSYTKPRELLWSVGVVIYILMMATAFLGYVLPWGQMSFWGATVITNFFSAVPYVGTSLVEFIWGGFSVDNATLNRFFSLHYLLPFILAALVAVHFIALHENGSNNPLGISSNVDKIPFHPYYTTKDIVGALIFFLIFFAFVFYQPNLMGHPDNYIPANPLVTPVSIVPEWYFLPFYAILRAIPSKLGGVVVMFASLLILLALPWLETSKVRGNGFRPIMKIFFWAFVVNFIILMYCGGQHAEEPFVTLSRIATLYHFLYFIVIVPVIGHLENICHHIGNEKGLKQEIKN